MPVNKELSIVIPCKNEEKFLPKLLSSLLLQSHSIKDVPIIIADAGSTDNTRKIILNFKKLHNLNIKIIKGGFPSQGRNSGARICISRYILFIDADVILSKKAIESSLALIKRKSLHCVTTSIFCAEFAPFADFMFLANNFLVYLSRLDKPYSHGAFMLFDRKRFWELSGFNEKILYSEDYFLTRQLSKDKFGIAFSYVLTSGRRFKRMGYLKIIKMVLGSAFNRNNPSYFFSDHGYWNH